MGRMARGDGTCRRTPRKRCEGGGISSWQSAARRDRKTLRQRGALNRSRRACHLAFVPQGAQGEENRGDRPSGNEAGEGGAGRTARVQRGDRGDAGSDARVLAGRGKKSEQSFCQTAGDY